MVSFTFNTSNSITSSGAHFNSPDEGNPITVAADAFVLNTSAAADNFGLLLNGGNYNVTVNGIVGSSYTKIGIGMDFDAGEGLSKLVVGSAGSVEGSDIAIVSQHALNVTNSGTIRGVNTVLDLYGPGDLTITNKSSGHIEVPVETNIAIALSGSGKHTIVNAGEISGIILGLNLYGTERITNSGIVNGDLMLSLGDDSVTNSGTINGTLYMGEGSDTVTNTKLINGAVALGDGPNTLINRGHIGGGVGGGSEADLVKNAGTIDGGIDLGFGNDVLVNTKLITADVHMSEGDDTLTNFGQVAGDIHLGDGADTFLGGKYSDHVYDEAGIDSYKLGAGNDEFIAYDAITKDNGNDTADGGAGIDTYNASNTTAATRINLDTSNQDDIFSADPADYYTGKTATDTGVGQIGTDTISNFENAIGGSSGDRIVGNSRANSLDGNAGNDDLYGKAGNDILKGGLGQDRIVGGLGRDMLYGNEGIGADGATDHFVFTSFKDSTFAVAGRDVIFDFEDGTDIIDLNHMNVLPEDIANVVWNFIGTDAAYSGVAGEVRTQTIDTGWLITADLNGDKRTDFAVEVQDGAHSITWDFGDFNFGVV